MLRSRSWRGWKGTPVRFDGQVAVVTGAGRGIGRAVALHLAHLGASLVVNSATFANAFATAEQIRADTGRASGVVAGDVADPAVVERLFAEAMGAYSRVDILVNNAGITRDALLLRMKDEDWDAVLNTNLKSAFLCTRAAARIMLKQRRGAIVNVASVNGIVGSAGQSNYSASKGGLIQLTKSCAKELGARGIRVNAVAPGYISTDMTSALPDTVRESVLKQVPLARLGEPDDVAKAVAFLCGDEAAYITGQVLQVDGGLFM